jgi:hypothetical protein
VPPEPFLTDDVVPRETSVHWLTSDPHVDSGPVLRLAGFVLGLTAVLVVGYAAINQWPR